MSRKETREMKKLLEEFADSMTAGIAPILKYLLEELDYHDDRLDSIEEKCYE